MDYKKYSLENLENWLHDAMSAGEATPQEIYDVIVSVVKDNYYIYKKHASEAYELLALLNGNGQSYEDVMKEKEYYEPSMPPWGHSDMEALRYTEEELNAMCDKASSDDEKDKCREYNLREAEYYNKRAELDALTKEIKLEGGYDWTPVGPKDGYPFHINQKGDVWIPDYVTKDDKVKRWILPTEVDGLTGDVIINLPDDLLEAANLKEGDQIKWIDRGDGSFELRKVTQPLRIDEC